MNWYFEKSEEPLGAVQMMPIELEACPFCGKRDRLVITTKKYHTELVEKNGDAMISIECKRCDLELKEFDRMNCNDYDVLRWALIKYWNTRKEACNESEED